MFLRLILAAAKTNLGQDILIDLYKRYIRSPRPYFRKDYNR